MNARTCFLAITLGMALLAATCCVLPNALFYANTGRLPLRRSQDPFRVPIGSTAAEVREALGPPHDLVKRDGREVWNYHGDLFGLVIYGMEFDEEGRLAKVWW